MTLIWLPEARDDIERLFDFLVEVNPLAAEQAVRLIQSGAARLDESPECGRRMSDDSGRRELYLPFGASAYVLRYRNNAGIVVIIRVWHGRGQPARPGATGTTGNNRHDREQPARPGTTGTTAPRLSDSPRNRLRGASPTGVNVSRPANGRRANTLVLG